MFQGPTFQKGDGNLGALALNTDGITGMIFGGVVPTSGTYTALNTVVPLIQASDADALGFTAAYDAANKVLIRYHIDEFFAICPGGKLWIMVVAQTVTLAQMCDVANNYMKKLVNDSNKEVKLLGAVRNPATGYTATLSNGLDADVLAAVPKAQQLADTFAAVNVFIDRIVIEGREVNGAISAIKDGRTLASPNVGIAILQDADVAALDPLYAKHAAVGTELGSWAIRRVEEELGALQIQNNPDKARADFPLDDAATGRWQNVAISSGVLVKTLTAADNKTLTDRGYTFADYYPQYDGVFMTKGSALTLLTSDFAYSVNTRVWNKCARKAIKKLILLTNSTVQTDDSGRINPATVSAWEVDVNNDRDGLGSVVIEGNALKSKVYIDPNQAVYSGGPLEVKMSVRPYGYAREITGTLSFASNL